MPEETPPAPQEEEDGKAAAGREPMRDLKDRYIAPAISAFPPSMVVKLESEIAT